MSYNRIFEGVVKVLRSIFEIESKSLKNPLNPELNDCYSIC